MILGLKLLPRLFYLRDKQKEDFNDPYADEWLDCGSCMARYDHTRRARWGCPRVPEESRSWVDGRAEIETAFQMELDECPGFSVSLPEVYEAARAAQWANDGQLDAYYEGEPVTRLAIEYIDTFRASIKELEASVAREQRREIKKLSNKNGTQRHS